MSDFISVQNVRDELSNPFSEDEYYGEKANEMYSDEDIQATIADVLKGQKIPDSIEIRDEDGNLEYVEYPDNYWEDYSDLLEMVASRLRNGAYDKEVREERSE